VTGEAAVGADTAWVVRGNPTDAELAAVVAVLAAAAASSTAGGAAAAPEPDEGGWSAYWRGLRAPVAAGPGAWRASALPR
jgi:hypothetical protein